MNKPVMDYMRRYRFKKLLLLDDADTGLRAVIAIHSTGYWRAFSGMPPPAELRRLPEQLFAGRGLYLYVH